ncbi:hemerythrin HHE cation binding domain-containing protein [Diplogelasinospora grovesii]|uniref:Hemerythrin HHE cation binding domain-containing protein n=1 Tax=Diplogelasinospora grovesii TaxID=303347 RepID=A0AAN6MYA0_9PEZI|nr:hemerythrin HHE cation binding domain-containing protein [Diplogelasinospora grovesii]
MSPVYADHPFPLIQTPAFLLKSQDPNAKVDIFDLCASEMASVHNMMGRGFNAIYLQAPHIKQADEKAFCKFMLGWYNLLHIHHSGEEEEFFPDMEKMAGVAGIMEANVEQHHAFHDGIEAFKAYVDDVLAGKAKYDGQKVVQMFDSFGPALMQHLADEIPSLQSLRQYGEEKFSSLLKRFDQEGEKNIKALGFGGMVWCFANLDVHYENDMWTQWPPAPSVVKFVCRNMLWWFHASTVKFGAVDRLGNLKPLYAAAEEKSA